MATTTVGTTTSDYLDRTLGLGYVKSSMIELGVVIAVLVLWHFSTGSIGVDRISTRQNEIFYWVTILVANTLGTALGDLVATTTGLGFEGGALVFAGLLALVAAVYFFTSAPKSVLFWTAYVLTRPLGATLGDTLTKSHAAGGLDLSRIASSLAIMAAMAILVALKLRRQWTPAVEGRDSETGELLSRSRRSGGYSPVLTKLTQSPWFLKAGVPCASL